MKLKRPTKFQTFLLLCFGLFAIRWLFFRVPSETEMIAKFRERKAEFEQIQAMLQQDKFIFVIGPDWVEAQWDEKKSRYFPLDISAERLNLYRSRLKKLGFSGVVSRNGQIRLHQFGGGFTDTSWSIGYSWSSKTPTPLVKSAYYEMPGRDKMHFSRLEGHWYIYHRR